MSTVEPVEEKHWEPGDLLESSIKGVERVSPNQWRFPFKNGLYAFATSVDGWISLDALITCVESGDSLWEYLAANGQLAGSTRFALLCASRTIHLRADLPIGDENGLETALPRAIAQFTPAREQAKARPGSSRIELSDLLCEAGWNFTTREDQQFVVPLRGHGHPCPARVGMRDGIPVASVELAALDVDISPTSREALATLLLTAAGLVRMARPVVYEMDRSASVQFEAPLDPDADSSSLHHALSALSTASVLCGAEVDALKDQRGAEQFLAIRRCSRQ